MSDDFHARYRLLDVVAAGAGSRTHEAQEVTTGRVVMVHVVDATAARQVNAVRAALARLPAADKARVLETTTLPGGYAVVTEPLLGPPPFPQWLAERAATQPDQQKDDGETPIAVSFSSEGSGATGMGPGEFTRLFVTGGVVKLESRPAAPSVNAAPPEAPAFGGAQGGPAQGPSAVLPAPSPLPSPSALGQHGAASGAAASPAGAPAAAPTAVPRRRVPVPLIVAINAVVLLALGLVLYFVFRPKPVAAPGAPTALIGP